MIRIRHIHRESGSFTEMVRDIRRVVITHHSSVKLCVETPPGVSACTRDGFRLSKDTDKALCPLVTSPSPNLSYEYGKCARVREQTPFVYTKPFVHIHKTKPLVHTLSPLSAEAAASARIDPGWGLNAWFYTTGQ